MIDMEILDKYKNKLSSIRLMAMDIDGVLNSGNIITLDNKSEFFFMNVKDRMGLHLIKLSELDIHLSWITARKSDQVSMLAKEFNIDFLYQGSINKLKDIQECADRISCKQSQVFFLGDDLVDLAPLRWAGFSACPMDAVDDVKHVVDYVSNKKGGEGIFREMSEMVIKSYLKWDFVLSKF